MSDPISERLIVLLKGPNGAGKTETALGFPKPLLVIQGDANSRTFSRARARGEDVREIFAKDWETYANVYIPHIVARQVSKLFPDSEPWEPKTIVVDPYSSIADQLVSDVIGINNPSNTQQLWGKIFRLQKDSIRDLVFASKPDGSGHPGYNIVMNCHLTDVKEGMGDKSRLVRVAANVPGQFKDKFEKDFDYVLLLASEIVRKVEGNKVVATKGFKIYSVSPDRYNTCKGGELPPEIDVPEGGSAFELLNAFWKLS